LPIGRTSAGLDWIKNSGAISTSTPVSSFWLLVASTSGITGSQWSHISPVKPKTIHVVPLALAVVLVINFAVLAGTLLKLPPFSSILAFGHSFKEAAAIKYGEPPYGHVELSSMALLVKRIGIDPMESGANLSKAGIHFANPEQSLLVIARENATTPKAIYEAMHPPVR
jgi:hypothetical protein